MMLSIDAIKYTINYEFIKFIECFFIGHNKLIYACAILFFSGGEILIIKEKTQRNCLIFTSVLC